jgi:hypothetical protein
MVYRAKDSNAFTDKAASETDATTVLGRVIDIGTEDLMQPQVEMLDVTSV